MKDLEDLRKDIDRIDAQLVALFEERMDTVVQVAEYKKENNIPILNSEREDEVIKKNCALLKNQDYASYLKTWLENTMFLSREIQEEYIKSEK